MNIRNFLYLTLITYNLTLISCCTEDNIPREKAYPRFYFPKKEYKSFTSECGFSFELPTYTVIENKDSFQKRTYEAPC